MIKVYTYGQVIRAMPMTRSEAYSLLEVNEGATLEEIRSKYKKQALRWHPDKHGNSRQSTMKFQELTEAYKLLTEEEEDPETWAELFADLVKLFQYSTGHSHYHKCKVCQTTHPRGWDSGESDHDDYEDGKYWYTDDEEDYEREKEYQKSDYHFVDRLLGDMLFKNGTGMAGKENYGFSTRDRLTREEAERNAAELIKQEEEEKRQAENKKLKNKKKREKKRISKAKKKSATKPDAEVTEKEQSLILDTEDREEEEEEDTTLWDTSSAFVKSSVKLPNPPPQRAPLQPVVSGDAASYFSERPPLETVVPATFQEPPSPIIKQTVNPFDYTDQTPAVPPPPLNMVEPTWTKPVTVVPPQQGECSEADVKESRKLAANANRLALSQQYVEAVAKFDEAIKLCSQDQRYYGNRSFCYEHLGNHEKALEDAEIALSISPNWPKGHFRKGKALFGLQKYPQAEEAYLHVLALDSSYSDAKMELERTRLHCITSLGFTEAQYEKVFQTHNTIPSAVDFLLGPSPKRSPVKKQDDLILVSGRSKPPAKHSKANPSPPPPPPTAGGGCPAQTPILRSVWVGNVGANVKEKQLKDLFSQVGKVESLKVLPKRRCAFVNYVLAADAVKAIDTFQDMILDGESLLVRYPDNPKDAYMGPPKKDKSGSDKMHGPVNGDECYFWRTTGCNYGVRCFYKHIPGHEGVDLKDYMATGRK